MFPDSSISLVKVNLKVESVLMLYFHLYNYAIQNNLVSESYDATWSCPWDILNISTVKYSSHDTIEISPPVKIATHEISSPVKHASHEISPHCLSTSQLS